MSEESNHKYEDCIFKDQKCENHKRKRIDGIFKIKDLKDCCKDHLKSLKPEKRFRKMFQKKISLKIESREN